MKKELKIDLGIYGNTVIGQTLDMDDSERGKDLLLRLDDNKIIKELRSFNYPDLTYNKVYVSGELKKYDDDVFIRKYSNKEESQQVYTDILRLVEAYNKRLNKPKFEESEEYKHQVKINELLMDIRKWQFENDEPVDIKKEGSLYAIDFHLYGIAIASYSTYRPLSGIMFSSSEKAEKCVAVFKNRIEAIYGNGGND